MVESADGRLYLVGERGVEVSDTSGKKFEFIRFETHVGRLPFDQDMNMYYSEHSSVCLPDNRLAICSGNKFIILDLSKRSSVTYVVPPTVKPEMPTITRMLQVDTKGRPYFVYQGRVFRLTEQGELKLLWENTIDPSLRISAAFIDRSDVLWVSVNAQGIYKMDLRAFPFRAYGYKTSFVADIVEQSGASSSLFPAGWGVREASYYFRQAYDSKGNLYLTDNYYRLNTGEVFRLDQKGLQLLPGSEKDRGYRALLAMPNDEIWVFDQWRSCWICLMKPGSSKPEILQLKEDFSSVEIADARYIGGYIWMTTYYNGLLQYDRDQKINQFSGKQPNGFMPKGLTEICPDPLNKNRFWIGSRGDGLILWDVEKGLQQVFTIEDGLPNNTIYCILPEPSGKIWCSTNKGIFRFDPVTKQVTTFEKTDGLSGNEFNRAHKFLFPDGRMAFGGLDGYTIFNPADFDIKNKRGEVPVSLTGLQINSEQQDANIVNSIISQPLPELSVIDLPYNKNYLRFEFAAMLFNQPQKTKYRYQLVGADRDWVENGTNNIASYAALAPGRYTLKLNATDTNGLWSDMVKEIAIHIHPPFWRTWWAYLLYVLIAVVLLRTYFVFRERRIKAEQSLAFEKREALRLKEVDELKDRFFSNITHEFRTPLTLIISPLEKLAKDPSLSPSVINSVKTAKRNSQQLLRLINEFLDFSKLNDGQLKLKLSTGELDMFTADCVQSFEVAASEKNIRLTFSTTGVAGLYLFDEDKWEKIIVNLVGNALKFTPQNGAVAVSLSAIDEDAIQLEIKDNGPGIPADQQERVFDRFYQVDDSSIRVSGGTGIGLSLVKELAELMKGQVDLESKPGEFTRFTVQVPLQKVLTHEGASVTDKMPAGQPTGEMNGDELPLLLIAEDNDELRAFLVESMSKHYRVIETNNGIKAEELILQELPDIIISDVMMPGRDGFDLCRICKTDNRTAHIGFILLTAKAAHDARLKGLGTGADDYITKPFHLEELELRATIEIQCRLVKGWSTSDWKTAQRTAEGTSLRGNNTPVLYQSFSCRSKLRRIACSP
jgi:signal transduction histidine kinase/CheY-like chemotaxis protein